MKWFTVTAAIMLAAFVYMYIQASAYKVRYYRLPAGTGLRLLHLTDIHIGLLHISARRIRKTIEKVKPDYILISGDLLDKPGELPKLIRFLADISMQIPVYCTLGNHDNKCFKKHPAFRQEFLSAMQKLNIRVLTNEVVFLRRNNEEKTEDSAGTIALVGLDDCKAGIPVQNQIFHGLREKSEYVIAISHNPDIVLRIPEGSVDLLVAGHFHGGQMWVPFKLEYLLLRKDILPKMGHVKGFSEMRNNRIYISRGLGTVLFPFRFFSVPEVTVFDV